MKKILLLTMFFTPFSVLAEDSTMEFLEFIKPGFINELCTHRSLPYHNIYKDNLQRCNREMGTEFDACILSGELYVPKTIDDNNQAEALGEKLAVCIARHLKQKHKGKE